MSILIEVVGTPGGDGECWNLAVDEATYRRVVGEKSYESEMDERRAARGHEWEPPPGVYYLYPEDLLRAAGYDGDGPVTLNLYIEP